MLPAPISRASCLLLLLVLLAGAACHTPTPTGPPTTAGPDCGADVAQCEQALLSAPDESLAELLNGYAERHEGGAYRTLYKQLRSAKGAVWLQASGAAMAPDGMTQLAAPKPPKAVGREKLVMRLARAAKRDDVLLASAKGVVQLFPRDVLAVHTFDLHPVVASSPEHARADVILAQTLREAYAAASRYDYIQAADKAEKLRNTLFKQGAPFPTREPQLRARFGLARLNSAGILLQTADDDDDDDDDSEPPTLGDMSSAYSDFFAVTLSKDEDAQYQKRRARITAHLDPLRAALLDVRYSEGKCPLGKLPEMTRTGDMAFAYQLSIALDPTAAPGEKAAPGKLGLGPWLDHYGKLVAQVRKHKRGWAFASTLLNQRGELHGLSASGTTAYKYVSEMALAHIAALDKLSAARPARFQTLGVVGLVYRPGAWTDPRVGGEVAKLVQQSVQRKLSASKTVDEAWTGTLAAFAAGLSYPSQMQAVQMKALKEGLAAKLSTPFGKQPGWGIAGLHGAQMLLEVMVQPDAELGGFGPRISKALQNAATLPQPELARLGAATAQYITLAGNNQLDAGVTNPRMFSPARRQAREALGDAIGKLAEGGPQTPGERGLRDLLASFGDELVAGVLAHFGEKSDGPQCSGQSAIAPKSSLRDAFDRLQKKRRTLLERPEMKRGDGDWVRRTRVLALLLSDVLDVIDRSGGKLDFSLSAAQAQRIMDEGLSSFGDPDLGTLAASIFLVVRGLFDDAPADDRRVVRNLVRGLNAAASVFGEAGTERGGIFQALAKVGHDKRLLDKNQSVAKVVMEHAEKAYGAQRMDLGDMLLMMALGSTLARDEPAPVEAVAMARKHDRPIELALLLYTEKAHALRKPEELAEAMRKAVQQSCTPPNPESVLKVRRAGRMFKAGKRKEATQLLDQLLTDSARDGLVVPKQMYNYQQVTGDKIVNVEQSLSFGGPLLKGSGSLQLGLGYQSRSENKEALSIYMAPTSGTDANEEAARLYAHAAILASVYHRLLGNHQSAEGAARRAIAVWAKGVRLGPARVLTGSNTREWVNDALPTVAIAAQQAIDHETPFLAGDLWTLVLAGLGEEADDSAVSELLSEAPYPIEEIDELKPVMARAKQLLPTLAAHLTCTANNGKPAKYVRIPCKRYPEALALRVAGGLKVLPRLANPRQASGTCEAWRALDDFLGDMDEQNYQPDKFRAAVRALRTHGHHGDASTLLTRQRHPNHCTPELVKTARELTKRTELGVHERANLLSIVANCDATRASDRDLEQLDALTQQHASPTRSFELLVFTARLAAQRGRYGPLYKISHKPHFVRRWHKLGPQMGTAALLLQHAAASGFGKPVDERATLPFYRLLCTTFSAKERGPMCNSIALMRGDSSSSADKKRAAKQALESFIRQALAQP